MHDVAAIGLVIFMKESMEVHDGYGHKLNYGVLDLLRVPCEFAPRRHTPNINNGPGNFSPTETKLEAASSTLMVIDTYVSSINTIRYKTPGLSATPNHSARRIGTIALYVFGQIAQHC